MTITGNFLFPTLILLGMVITIYSAYKKEILLSLSASLIWMGIFFWTFYSSTPLLDISEDWARLLSGGLILLIFIPLVAQIDFNTEKEEEIQDEAEAYIKEFRSKMRRSSVSRSQKSLSDIIKGK